MTKIKLSEVALGGEVDTNQSLDVSRMDQSISKVPGVGDIYEAPFNLRSQRPAQRTQPLVILFTWLGASKKSVRKYVSLYTEKGVDCLVVQGYLSYFIRPLIGMNVAKRLLNYLIYEQDKYDKYFVHAFSIGAFMLTLCAIHIRDNTPKFGQFQRSLRAVVMDSVTVGSLENMAKGVANAASEYSMIRWTYFKTVMLFFKMSPSTVRFYEDTVSHIFSAPFDVPSLFYCSLNDPMCNFTELTKLTNNWRTEMLSPVMMRSWKKSAHTAHISLHREEYLQAFEEFCKLVPKFFPSDIKIVSKL